MFKKKGRDGIDRYTMEYCSAIKKNKILPFATTWMDLEGVLLSKIGRAHV